MLPGEYLTFSTKKGKIHPKFAALEEGNLELAQNLIEVYAANTGRKKGELLELLEEMEKFDYDYRFIRGLSTLLERRCSFEARGAIEPPIARRKVFEEANKLAPVTTKEKRDRVLYLAAASLNLAIEELEKSLWADLDEELILKSFTRVTPAELLRWYNLSLAQTLLFKAMSMEFQASDSYSLIFRKIKYLGLMYFAEKRSDGLWIAVEGAPALFKLTEKYGTALAKLLPIILGAGDWRIKASIVMRYGGSPRIYEFLLDSSSRELLAHFEFGEREVYDSAVESNFAHRFDALKTGWVLKREPEPLVAGTSIFIPDFSLEKDGMQLYLEIAGFWTEDYLRRKLQKLRQLRETNMIIAIDKSLACSDIKEIPGKIIFFEKEIPLKPVLDYLKAKEEQKIERDMAQFSTAFQLELSGDMIKIEDLVTEYKASPEVIKRIAANAKGYSLIGDQLISESAIARLRNKVLELFPKPNFKEVADLLQREGITNPEILLDVLGFAVKWEGLDMEKAIVITKIQYTSEAP